MLRNDAGHLAHEGYVRDVKVTEKACELWLTF